MRLLARIRLAACLSCALLLATLWLVSAAALGQTGGAPPGPALAVHVGEPATVEVWNRAVVKLRAAIDDIQPQQRAATIRERIESLPYADLADQVRAEPATLGNLTGFFIYVGATQILGLLPEDVDPESGQTLEPAAQQAADRLREVLKARAEQLRLPVLLRGVALSAAATLLYGLAIWGVWRLRRAVIRQQIARKRRLDVAGVNIRPFFVGLEHTAVTLTAWGLGLVGGYIWLTLVLGGFPYTRPLGERLGGFLLGLLKTLALGALEAAPGLFTVLVILLLTRLVTRGIGAFFDAVAAGRLAPGWVEAGTAQATRRLVVAVAWMFAVVVAYPYIPGSDTAAFKGIGVLVGLMVSLGSAGFINQIMSGLALVYSRAFGVGDYVRVGEKTEGTVTDVGMLSTKLVTRKREEITLPNAVLVGSMLINYSRLEKENGSILSTSVTIGYDTPWRQVHALLELAADRTPGVRKEPKPVVLQRALSDFYVEYQLLAHMSRPAGERIAVLSALHAQIQDAFNEHGVQIMSPHFQRQPERAVMVPRDQWHAAPAEASPAGDA